MNHKILFSVSTAVMLLGTINANAALTTTANSNASTPIIPRGSIVAGVVQAHNKAVYLRGSSRRPGTLSNLLGGNGLNEGNVAVIMGIGSDPQLASIRAECLDGTIIKPPAPTSAIIDTSGRYSRYRMLKDVSSSGSAGLNWGVFSGNGSGYYSRFTKRAGLDLVYNYKAEYRLGSLFLSKPVLNMAGQDAADIGQMDGYKTFRNDCGSRYLRQANVGGALYFSVKLSFNTYYDKKVTGGKVKASFWGFKGGGSWNRVSQETRSGGKMTIMAIQSGGDVLQLGKYVGFGDTTSIECDFSQISKCTAFADRLMTYASNVFPKQLSATRYDNAIKTFYSSYAGVGIPFKLPYPGQLTRDFFNDPIWQNRLKLRGLYVESVVRFSKLDKLTSYYTGAGSTTPGAASKVFQLGDIEGILIDREMDINQLNERCWTQIDTCQSEYDFIMGNWASTAQFASYNLTPAQKTLLNTRIR